MDMTQKNNFACKDSWYDQKNNKNQWQRIAWWTGSKYGHQASAINLNNTKTTTETKLTKNHKDNVQTWFRHHPDMVQTSLRQHPNIIQISLKHQSYIIQTLVGQHKRDNSIKRPHKILETWFKHLSNIIQWAQKQETNNNITITARSHQSMVQTWAGHHSQISWTSSKHHSVITTSFQ